MSLINKSNGHNSAVLQKRPLIVSIDGNIGSGKTTLLEELQRRGYHVFTENVDHWAQLLKRFYEDPKRWCFTFQTMILNDSYHQYQSICKLKASVVFIERSPVSALAFVQNSVESGHINSMELQLYKNLHTLLGWTPDVTIALDASPALCMGRVRKRDRSGEQSVTLEYLTRLHRQYQKVLKHVFRVHRIDARVTTPNAADMVQLIIKSKMIGKQH